MSGPGIERVDVPMALASVTGVDVKRQFERAVDKRNGLSVIVLRAPTDEEANAISRLMRAGLMDLEEA